MRKAEEGLMHTVGFINFGVFLVSFLWFGCCVVKNTSADDYAAARLSLPRGFVGRPVLATYVGSLSSHLESFLMTLSICSPSPMV